MQFTTAIVALFVAVASAQDLSGLPNCAKSCFIDNFSKSNCTSQTDFKCLCSSNPYFTAVTGCVVGACGSDDINKSLVWAQDTCSKAGAPL